MTEIEVRVYQDGRLLQRQLCESEEDAAATVDEWSELEGVTCEVDDLAVRHRQGDILEPEPADLIEDEPGGLR
ncbi:hypothetical protein H4696_001124 [Amycolatopsis lexingtonensis]|uniref:Uncharacterized protein n=1 Tax=Amycolatopsis lexingtonensis TaxID=218822 RepID=A0ABR9HSX8_9PSEU|nr:hypothetical protein [Amycolatopsis lexingtonensis]MBE1494024.1 hypothetical protein [Amycolatopsis lexingtonensis]